MHAPQTSNSTEQPNNLAFWLQMELDLSDIVQVDRPQAQSCPMCCATLQDTDDSNLLRCPSCGMEIWL